MYYSTSPYLMHKTPGLKNALNNPSVRYDSKTGGYARTSGTKYTDKIWNAVTGTYKYIYGTASNAYSNAASGGSYKYDSTKRGSAAHLAKMAGHTAGRAVYNTRSAASGAKTGYGIGRDSRSHNMTYEQVRSNAAAASNGNKAQEVGIVAGYYVGKASSKVQEFAKNTVSSMMSSLGNLVSSGKSMISKAMSSVMAFVGGARAGLSGNAYSNSNTASGKGIRAGSAVASAISAMKDAYSKAKEWVKKVIGDVSSSITSAGRSAAATVLNTANNVGNAINEARAYGTPDHFKNWAINSGYDLSNPESAKKAKEAYDNLK